MTAGEGHPAILNAANEIAVDAFLHERVGFMDIPKIVQETLEQCPGQCDILNIGALLDLDAKARRTAQSMV